MLYFPLPTHTIILLLTDHCHPPNLSHYLNTFSISAPLGFWVALLPLRAHKFISHSFEQCTTEHLTVLHVLQGFANEYHLDIQSNLAQKILKWNLGNGDQSLLIIMNSMECKDFQVIMVELLDPFWSIDKLPTHVDSKLVTGIFCPMLLWAVCLMWAIFVCDASTVWI